MIQLKFVFLKVHNTRDSHIAILCWLDFLHYPIRVLRLVDWLYISQHICFSKSVLIIGYKINRNLSTVQVQVQENGCRKKPTPLYTLSAEDCVLSHLSLLSLLLSLCWYPPACNVPTVSLRSDPLTHQISQAFVFQLTLSHDWIWNFSLPALAK